jgi:YD repeat-containing protein
MFKRTLPLAALTLLLVSLMTPTVKVVAFKGGTPPAQERAKAQAERMIEGARQGITYDEAGRVAKTTVQTSESEKVTVGFKYDERNRIQSVVLDDSTQIGMVYDAAGLWQGFSFPDGGKMLFKRNAAGEIVGVRRIAKPTGQKGDGANKAGVRRVGFSSLPLNNCASALASAVAASAAAVATCLQGPSIQCAAAVANAAIASAKAYDACRDKTPEEEESAV